MDLDTLVPAGGGSLSRPVLGPHRQVVASFTPHQATDPDAIWEPFTRTTETTRGGQQGAPLGYRPGHGLEHEPLDQDERNSDHLVQNVFSLHDTGGQIRSALRPGGF